MVTSLISVQSKKKNRQRHKIYSTRKLKVLFRNSNHLEKFWKIFPRPDDIFATFCVDFRKIFPSDFLIKLIFTN